MTDDEVKLLLHHSKRWSPKFKLMLSFGLFRGLRIGETLAINILDFKDDFKALRVITEKSHIEDTLPLIPQHTKMIREYVMMNKHTFKDGYLFPFYSSRKKCPHMTPGVAQSMFAKMRKIIGKDHHGFLDHHTTKKGFNKYRISFHSCRRWFETSIHNHIHDRKVLADIMRYLEVSTVDTYINPYETWKVEANILEDALGNYMDDVANLDEGQTKLDDF